MSGAKKKPGDSPKSNKAGPSGMDKKSLFSIQNFVRDPSNGVPRLQTFRPPRDLSLGGTKPKKIFTPNLNVARNKNKPKEDTTSKETKKPVRNHEPKTSPKSKFGQKFVQTEGVFSTGSGDFRPVTGIGFGSFNAKKNEDIVAIPKIRKKPSFSSDIKKEGDVAKELLRDSDSDEELDDIYNPRLLDGEIFIDKALEPQVISRLDYPKKEVKKAVVEEEDFTHDFLRNESRTDSKLSFSLIKFPESLPARNGIQDPNDDCLDFKLSSVGDGKIGKIIIRKSGKMQLQIGQKFYDFGVTRNPEFTQDVVAQVDDNGQKKLSKVGSVITQYVATPDWKRCLQ